MKDSTLTPASFALFSTLVNDAKNWEGTPMVDITKEQRGNLTDLKRNGLLHTEESDNIEWAFFDFDGAIRINGVEFFNDLNTRTVEQVKAKPAKMTPAERMAWVRSFKK